jgi:RNA polymerase sigma-70 factor (ECF subfamily)
MGISGDAETPPTDVVTDLLARWGKGDRAALDELLPLVYRELHKMAKRQMAQQREGHTLQTTAVIHEAYLKLAGGVEQDWESRGHFFAVAAKAMRQVLVDHARKGRAEKRGGAVGMIPATEGLATEMGPAEEMLAPDGALGALSKSYPRQAEVVELRYFGGLSVEDTARTLKVSPETVTRDWRFARSFLRRQMEGGGAISAGR